MLQRTTLFFLTDQARAVLQTYTVSLAEVKKDINLWKEPLQAEMEALVGSGTIRRVKVEQLTMNLAMTGWRWPLQRLFRRSSPPLESGRHG